MGTCKTVGKLNLFERMCRRGAISKTVTQHVRAELNRLAGQIRKMDVVRQEDVLRLIREARK
jgi:hypothetical protein